MLAKIFIFPVVKISLCATEERSAKHLLRAGVVDVWDALAPCFANVRRHFESTPGQLSKEALHCRSIEHGERSRVLPEYVTFSSSTPP